MPIPLFAVAEALQRAQTDAGVAVKRCEELEAELQQLKASSSVMSRLFQMPTKQDVLAGLGLELWKDDRLRWKTGDVEVSLRWGVEGAEEASKCEWAGVYRAF